MSAPVLEVPVPSPVHDPAPTSPDSPLAAAAVLLLGTAFLVARPLLLLPALPGVPLLGLGYLALLGLCLRRRATRPRSTPLPALSVLAIGLGAFGGAAALAGPSTPVRAGAVAFVLNLLAALAEEAFFRRFLFARLEPRGAAVAIVGSALAFALVHVPSYGTAAFPVDLGAGLLLSWQRWACGRWTVPAATHAAANLLAVIR